MKRTLRSLAVPLLAALMLAGCGHSDTAEPEPSASAQAKESDGGSEKETSDRNSVTDSEGTMCAPFDYDPVEDLCADSDGPVMPSDGGDPDAMPATDSAEEDGYYSRGQYTVIGFTSYLLTIPADEPEDIKQYREKVGEDEAGYISVDVDNADGEDYAEVSGVVLVDVAGETYTYEPVWSAIGDWQDRVDIESDEVTYDEGTDLYNKYLDGDVPPTAKRTVWLIGPKVPEKMTYVEMDDRDGAHEPTPLA